MIALYTQYVTAGVGDLSDAKYEWADYFIKPPTMLDLEPGRHCVSRYQLDLIQCIGMPKMNAETIVTFYYYLYSGFAGRLRRPLATSMVGCRISWFVGVCVKLDCMDVPFV